MVQHEMALSGSVMVFDDEESDVRVRVGATLAPAAISAARPSMEFVGDGFYGHGSDTAAVTVAGVRVAPHAQDQVQSGLCAVGC